MDADRSRRLKHSPSSSSRRRSKSSLSAKKIINTDNSPISSGTVSSSVKRPAAGLLNTSAHKRPRNVATTPSETMTPRATIRAFLSAADTKSIMEISVTDSLQSQSNARSVISNRQVEKVIESETRRRSPRRKSVGQSFSTPTESLTPRKAIKLYLNAAETVSPNECKTAVSTPLSNTQIQKTRVELGENSQNDQQFGERRDLESGEETPFSGATIVSKNNVETITDNNVQCISQSNSESDNFESDNEDNASCKQSNVKTEYEMERKHKNMDIVLEDNFQISPNDNSESWDSEHSRGGNSSQVEWGGLKTPILPNITIAKATPVVPGKPRPNLDEQQWKVKTSNKLSKKKAPGKENKTKNNKRFLKRTWIPRLPSSLVNGIFRHFSALRVSKDGLDGVHKASEAFFKHISSDLKAFCEHGGRKTIEECDVELLMKRQSLVKSRESFHALIEKYLPMEYRQDLIPSAKSGNKVIPKMKTA